MTQPRDVRPATAATAEAARFRRNTWVLAWAATVGIALALAAGSARAGVGAAPGFGARLAEMVRSGRITRPEADLYRLYAVKAAERLPPGLRAGSTPARLRGPAVAPADPVEILRCGTPALRAARAALAGLPPALRAEAEDLLGPTGDDRAAGRAAAQLSNGWATDNFTFEWGPDLTDEDGSSPPRDDDADGVPDVVELWADYFETSYAEEIGAMGYGHPDLDANRITVYLGNSDPSTSIDNITSGTYAFTASDEPLSYIVVNNDLTFVPPNGEGASGLAKIHGAMKITAAHELFHVVHFLYEPSSWKPTEDDWWFETSATWMEDEVFDSVNDYYQYYGPSGWTAFVADGLAVPFDDPHYTVRAYGGAIFAKYLSEHVGGRQSLFDVWAEIRPETSSAAGGRRILDALDAYAADQGFAGGLGGLFLGFAAANAVMDYEEGANYGTVPVDDETGVGTASFDDLGYLGARYRSEVVSGTVTLTYPTPTDTGWGVGTAYRSSAATYAYDAAQADAGEVSLELTLPTARTLYVAAARISPDAVAPPPSTGGGGGGGGCFLQALGRLSVP